MNHGLTGPLTLDEALDGAAAERVAHACREREN